MINFNFYKTPAFKMTMICTGCVVGGVALKLVWDESAKRLDLFKSSYEAIEKALAECQNDVPKFDSLESSFKAVAKKCKKNERVVRLMAHLETIRVLGKYKADASVGLTEGQNTLLNQAFSEARTIVNEKLGKK